MLHSLISLWFTWVQDWGYWGVFILMALESTVVPVPSELIMPPAAFWAAQGQMSLSGVILAGTAGSYLGSALSYLACRWAGDTLLARYGKFFLVTPEKIAVATTLIKKHGSFGIFISRLLPVVRHLISMPAGLFKMHFGLFSVITIIGAGIWCTILAVWGQRVLGAHPDLLNSPEDMMRVVRTEMVGFISGVVAILVLYIGVVLYKKRSKAHPPA